jgi:hypothetical protein
MKPDCGLCHEMRELVEPVLAEYGAFLVEKDVRSDPELESRYLLEIPVLLLSEVEVARHRVTPDELRKQLASLGLASRRDPMDPQD